MLGYDQGRKQEGAVGEKDPWKLFRPP